MESYVLVMFLWLGTTVEPVVVESLSGEESCTELRYEIISTLKSSFERDAADAEAWMLEHSWCVPQRR